MIFLGIFLRGGGRKIQVCPRAPDTLATPLAVAAKHDTVDLLEVIDGQAIYYSKFNFFVKINQTISNFYIYHKCMTYHIYYIIF